LKNVSKRDNFAAMKNEILLKKLRIMAVENGTTLDGLARKAGLTRMTLYNATRRGIVGPKARRRLLELGLGRITENDFSA